MAHICNEPHCTLVADWEYTFKGEKNYVCSQHDGLARMRLRNLGHQNELDHAKFVAFVRLWPEPTVDQNKEQALLWARGEIERLKGHETRCLELEEQNKYLQGEVDRLTRTTA